MALDFGASSKAELSAPGITSYPCTFFCYIRPASASANGMVMGFGDNGGAAELMMYAEGAGTGKLKAFSRDDGGDSISAESTTALSAAGWVPAMVVFTNPNNRVVYYGAGAAVFENTANAPTLTAFDRFVIGCRGISDTLNFVGGIAHPAAWLGALTQTNFNSLAAGAVPSTIASGSLWDYWAFNAAGPTATGVNGRVLTLTGVSVSSSDPISGAGDTTNPNLTGSITVSALTTTSYTLTWPAGSDNVAVTGYEYSLNGGSSYTTLGNVLTTNITGRTPGSTDSVRVRAFDAAGNRSTPALSTSVTLNSPSAVGFNLNSAVYAFKNNTTTLLSSRPITFWVHDATTGALIGSAITGLSTNASGIVTSLVSNASLVAATTYRVDYKLSTGEFGVAMLTAA